MTIKSSGSPLKFSDISKEFGTPTGNKLGNYRVNQEVGDADFRLDEGMPIGNQSIKFSDFYGKRLNTVVHYSSNENRPSTARSRYSNNIGVTVIGGFKSRPSNSSGTRVIIHVSATIGGGGGRTSCSLRTGSWNGNVNEDNGTKLDIEVGGTGGIYGRGGNGGRGGNDGETGETDGQRERDATGQPGQDGSSAIGISYYVENINVQNGGRIYAGGGGGGGGGGARNEEEEQVAGAGGGGGAGIPAGGAGARGNHVEDAPDSYSSGGAGGGTTSGGNGGKGGYELEEESGTKAGGGGGGGSFFTVGSGGLRGGAPGNGNAEDDDAEDGEDGGPSVENNESKGGRGGRGDAEKNEQAEGSGGAGGNNGYSIIVSGVSSPGTSGETDQIRGSIVSGSFS